MLISPLIALNDLFIDKRNILILQTILKLFYFIKKKCRQVRRILLAWLCILLFIEHRTFVRSQLRSVDTRHPSHKSENVRHRRSKVSHQRNDVQNSWCRWSTFRQKEMVCTILTQCLTRWVCSLMHWYLVYKVNHY